MCDIELILTWVIVLFFNMNIEDAKSMKDILNNSYRTVKIPHALDDRIA